MFAKRKLGRWTRVSKPKINIFPKTGLLSKADSKVSANGNFPNKTSTNFDNN